MKILYVVSGIGFGDATREHANIVALKKRFPKAKIMVAGYDNSYDYFKDKYETIRIQGYKLPGKSMKVSALSFGLHNIFLPGFWLLGTLKVRLEAFKFIPDIVVSDFEPVGISLAKVLKKKCIVVFGFDPLLYKEYAAHHKVNIKMQVEAKYFEKLYDQADIVVIPSFRRKREPHLLYTYVNPIVRTQPKELPSEKFLMKKLRLKKKPLLVMLGGSEFGAKLAQSINKVAGTFADEQFIIFGGNLDMPLNRNVKYIRYTPDFLQYLKVSKGIITLAGQKTLSEALVYKKPILCFPIQDHIEQILNTYALRDVIHVGHDSSQKQAEKKIREFLDELPQLTKKMERFNVQSNGSEQIAQIIEQILKK